MRVAMRKALSISCVTMMLVALVCSLSAMISSSMTELVTGSKPGGRFVKEDQFGLQHQGAGQSDALASCRR